MVWTFYGLKSAGNDFRNHLADCMHHFGILSCPEDLDLWLKPMVRPEDRFNYYTYVIIYVDDVMVIHHDTDIVIFQIDKYFKLKPRSIGDPDIYLGSKLNNMRLKNEVWAWTNSQERYVKESVTNMEKYLAELADVHWQLPKMKAYNPFIWDYASETDETPCLGT